MYSTKRAMRLGIFRGTLSLGVLLTASCTNGELSADTVAAMAVEGAEYDATSYAEVLKRFVDDVGRVDYKGLKSEVSLLDGYLEALGTLPAATYAGWEQPDQIALWINAYNAFTLKAILNHYPIQKGGFIAGLRFPANSIRQISGVWDKLQWTVMGEGYTLNQIEHEVLRKQFNEPRIHLAIVCASVGCPILRNQPFEGGKLSEQLDDQARAFLGDETKFRIDQPAKTVYLSRIFDWFGSDFEAHYASENFGAHDATERAVLHFVSGYLSDEHRGFLEAGAFSIAYLDYDWSLNERN